MLKYVARASLIMLPCLLWAGTDISGSRSGCWYAAREVSDSHLLKNGSFSLTQLWYTMQSRYLGETAHVVVIPGSRGLSHFLHIILLGMPILDSPWKMLSPFGGGLAVCAGVSTLPSADLSIYFFKRKQKYEVVLVFFFLYRHNQTDRPACTWLANI